MENKIDKILMHGRSSITIYYTNGREPFTVAVTEENLLEVIRDLLYTKEASCIIALKAA